MWPERSKEYVWQASERLTNRDYHSLFSNEYAEDYDNMPPKHKGVKTNKRLKARLAKQKKKRTRR